MWLSNYNLKEKIKAKILQILQLTVLSEKEFGNILAIQIILQKFLCGGALDYHHFLR
mgnify:CR=1 FL=1